MPSPFPGMDPYLEHPEYFPNLHNRLITYLEDALQVALPDAYFAKSGQRAWVEYGEFHEPFVEIYTGRGEDKRLVTALEVLSPSNKAPGNQGRDLYLQKQREVLYSKAHLVEVDLLRSGTHTTAVPHQVALAQVGVFDYHICVRRFDERDRYHVYPIQLAQPLPQIMIPLLPGDGEVPLDLQAVFARCYDAGPYRREIRYDRETPEPPLRPDQEAWAKKLLHGAGVFREP